MKEELEFLESLARREWRMDIGPFRDVCAALVNPQNEYPSVHIAGTNGKGSTAAFLASILKESDCRAGLYTSPHLIDVRERIQINGSLISEKDFLSLINKTRACLPKENQLTYFEFLTLLAFMYFKNEKVDVAVIETGLGGRLDATNVVTPNVAVITSISADHERHLGRALVEIAKEKCGIIKRGVPTVVAPQTDDVMKVIVRACDDVGSPLFVADTADIKGPLGLAGEHQKQNAACAVEAADCLTHSGFKIKNIEAALKKARWGGRLEVVSLSPHVILDGAHNPAGAIALANYIGTQVKRERCVLVLGVLSDKDISGICRALIPCVREVICVKTPLERSASPKDVAAIARSFGAKVHQEEDVEQALTKWIPKLGEKDVMFVSGSLSTVGAAKGFFMKK